MLTTAKEMLLEASCSGTFHNADARTFTPKQKLGILDKLARKGKSYWQGKWENAQVKIEFVILIASLWFRQLLQLK